MEKVVAGPGGEQRLLLITTVDIGEGRSDQIVVREGDDVVAVAAAFVAKHSLPNSVLDPLEQHIRSHLAVQPAVRCHLRCALSAAALRRPPPRPTLPDQGRAAVRLTARRLSRRNLQDGPARGDPVSPRPPFDRLYEQASVLQSKLAQLAAEHEAQEAAQVAASRRGMSWISAEMMRDRSSGRFGNYGEMLYAESIEMLARKQEQARLRQAERLAGELAGVTFQPEISALARARWEGDGYKAWQRLSASKPRSAAQLAALRAEREEAALAACTFTPVINKRSNALMSERAEIMRNLRLSAHHQLYQDATRRQLKQDEYAQCCPEEATFAPKLHASPTSRELLRRSWERTSGRPVTAPAPVVERLYAHHAKVQHKLQEARRQVAGSIDPSTGRRLFHPETGRPPAMQRNGDGRPVGEHLYNRWLEAQQRAAASATAREEARARAASASKVAPHSAVLIRRLHERRLREIFEFLDKRQAGAVDLASLVTNPPAWMEELEEEVRDDLELAVKLQGAPTGVVDAFTFNGLMRDALARRRGPRSYLAPSPPPKYEPADNFHPHITERSKQLAAKLRPKDVSVYEVLHSEASAISAKLAERRAAQAGHELQGCTFAPKLVAHALVSEGRVMPAMRAARRARDDADHDGAEFIIMPSSPPTHNGPELLDSPSQPGGDLLGHQFEHAGADGDPDERHYAHLEQEVHSILAASSRAAEHEVLRPERAGPALAAEGWEPWQQPNSSAALATTRSSFAVADAVYASALGMLANEQSALNDEDAGANVGSNTLEDLVAAIGDVHSISQLTEQYMREGAVQTNT